MDLKAHLTRLCEAHGPSGFEDPVREVLNADWEPLADAVTVDSFGNLYGAKWGSAHDTDAQRTVMLAAHMDEIGMMVREIDGAFIRVSRLGGIDERTLLTQRVIVHGKEPLSGIVAATPPHLLKADERKRYPLIDQIVIDVGLSAEEVADLVRIGDVVTVDAPVLELNNGRLAGKAMDDRACVAAVTVCLDELQNRAHLWDVMAVATVQEEVGARGAAVSAHRLNPDIAIALDVTFAKQPGVGESDGAYALGSGPVISIGPNLHPKLYEKLRDAAKRLEMTVITDPIPGRSGTDAWPIQVAQTGIPTALINVPIRNMHSSVEMVDLKDIKRAGRLLAEFIAGLEADFLTTIAWENPLEADAAEGDA